MIIITNPHLSQNKVFRDSLPTQSSNLVCTHSLQVLCKVENFHKEKQQAMKGFVCQG